MKVSYNKLWKLLIDRKMSKADLRKAVEIAPNTLTKILALSPEIEYNIFVYSKFVLC